MRDDTNVDEMGSGFAARHTAIDFKAHIGQLNLKFDYIVASFDVAYIDPWRVIEQIILSQPNEAHIYLPYPPTICATRCYTNFKYGISIVYND